MSRCSVDQIAAESVAAVTRFRSLEIACEGGVGSTSHSQTMAFNRCGRALPSVQDPKALFARLFLAPDGRSQEQAERLFAQRSSLLDGIRDQMSRLDRDLSAADRQRLAHFQDSVRQVERQLQRDHHWSKVAKPQVPSSGLALTPGNRIQWIDTVNAIVVLAMQTDSTRIASILYGVERDYYGWPERPKSNGEHHHAMQHHNGKERTIGQLQAVDELKIGCLTRLLAKLSDVDTPSGTLLDQTMIWYGHGMNNGTDTYERGMGGHSTRALSHLVLGGTALGLRHGRHLDYPIGAMPLSNLWVTMLRRFGLEIDSFVDSTGGMDDLLRA